MQMQAAILTAPNTPFRIETVTLDPPQRGEVLVKIAASGVCRSVWRVTIGTAPKPMPIIAGHEGAGVVEAVGAGVTQIKIGDHVTLTWAPNWGGCFYCLRGKANLCAAYRPAIASGLLDDGTARIHWKGEPVYILAGLGTFAEYALVRQESCVPIGSDLPLDAAALTLVGTAPTGSSTNLPGAVSTRAEKIVRGCSYGSVNPQSAIPLLLDLYRAGKLKLDELITRRYRLDPINEAYADLLSGELARGIIVF